MKGGGAEKGVELPERPRAELQDHYKYLGTRLMIKTHECQPKPNSTRRKTCPESGANKIQAINAHTVIRHPTVVTNWSQEEIDVTDV